MRRPHRSHLPCARARLRRRAPRRARPRGRQRDDPRRLAPDRSAPRHPGALPPLHDLPEPAAPVRGHAPRADRDPRRGAGAEPPRSATRSRRSAARSPPPRSRSASTAASRSSSAASKVFAGHVRRKATVDRDNDYLRPWRLLHTNASEWAARAGGAAVLRRASIAVTAVRLLPAARHRRLQDHADHPALPRPGVARRAGRGRTARRLRPRAEGAPDVARPQQHRPAAAPAAPAERPARPAVHELARPDPRLGRRWP